MSRFNMYHGKRVDIQTSIEDHLQDDDGEEIVGMRAYSGFIISSDDKFVHLGNNEGEIHVSINIDRINEIGLEDTAHQHVIKDFN